MRHGPHHGAQKSTSTGTVLDSTRSLNVLSVTGPAAAKHMLGIRRLGHERCLMLAQMK